MWKNEIWKKQFSKVRLRHRNLLNKQPEKKDPPFCIKQKWRSRWIVGLQATPSTYFFFQATVVSEGVARWEDNKKWQQKVEALRSKLAEKTREQEKAEKTIAMLREAVNRAEKDKAGLHSRLKRCVLDLFLFSYRKTKAICFECCVLVTYSSWGRLTVVTLYSR